MQNLLEKIKNDLSSKNKEDRIYAIRACCIQKICNDSIVELLNGLKQDDSIAMYTKISDGAIAALDILGIEQYKGKDQCVMDLIKSVFYSI